MMARMNEDGLGITIYHSLGKEVAALAKYAWRCQRCGSIYRRQRRSIQPRRHSCGACRGPLRELAVVQDEMKPKCGSGADSDRCRRSATDPSLPREPRTPHVRTMATTNSLR